MLHGYTQWHDHLTTRDPIWRPIGHARVTVNGRPNGESKSVPLFSILAPCYSDYESGPRLTQLAELAGTLYGPGFYGLESCQPA